MDNERASTSKKNEKSTQISKIFKKIYDTSQYNEEEQEDFIKRNIYRGLKATEGKLQLQPHQIKFVEKFFINTIGTAIMFHGVGSGKTLTTVSTAHFYLSIYPNNKVIIVSPPALLPNFIKEMNKFGLDIRDRRYSYFTYAIFLKFSKTKDLSKTLVIVDEAHNFRTKIIDNEYEEEDENGDLIVVGNVSKGKNSKKLITLTHNAHKILLLTATPFVNEIYDIANLLTVCNKDERIIQPKAFNQMLTNLNVVKDYFKYKVSHYERDLDSVDFPRRKEVIIPLITDQTTKRSDEVDSKDDPFWVNSKFKSNEVGDLKKDEVLKICLKGERTIIYSQFLNKGIGSFMRLLKENNLPFTVISGVETALQKAEAVKSYNTKLTNILLITKAGSEGVDTIETRNMVLYDVSWNDSLSEQVIARAIRFRSHQNLPIKERFVNVIRLLVVKPSDLPILEKINKGELSFAKTIQDFKVSRQTDKIDKRTPEITKFKAFDKNDYKEAVMNGTEKQYLSNLDYNSGANTQSQVLNSIKAGSDLYLYIYMKAKEEIINKFVRLMDYNFDMIEDFESNLESEYLDFIIDYQKENKIILDQDERNQILL
jgi:superfamily II DNA or RNA helicase